MKHSTLVASAFVIIAGAPTLADQEFAFDGMGSMLLEHEAEEMRGDAEVSPSSFRAPEPATGECEEEAATIEAQLEELRLSLESEAVSAHAELDAFALAELDAQRHRLEVHRRAVRHGKDQELLADVDAILAKTQRLLKGD